MYNVAWQFGLLQSNRALLTEVIEEPFMLAVQKKRERKDYEITEHTAGFYSQSTDCFMRAVRLFCKEKKPFQIILWQQQIPKVDILGKEVTQLQNVFPREQEHQAQQAATGKVWLAEDRLGKFYKDMSFSVCFLWTANWKGTYRY